MKTALLLEKLEGQLATLRQRCAPVSQFATLSARFDRHLFQTRATTLQACLDEAGDNLAALRHAVEQQQLPQVAWLAEHLAAQLEAIAREASAWSLREWDSAPPKIARWQRKRIQHQDFERRLREMVAERRARLARVTDLVEQQTLHREVEAYEARLARCRHALEKIENRLARLTRYIAKVVAWASKMGKTPIVVNDCPGFFVNRGCSPQQPDGAACLLSYP